MTPRRPCEAPRKGSTLSSRRGARRRFGVIACDGMASADVISLLRVFAAKRTNRRALTVRVLPPPHDFLNQFGIARGEARLVEPRIVLEARPAMAAGLQAPLIDLPLITADARGDPRGAGQYVGDLRAQKIEDRTTRRHRIGNPHDEL